MNIKKTILDFIKPLILASIALAGVAIVQGYTTWNEPTASPVGNNPDAPINVGDNTQTKIGSLIINNGSTDPQGNNTFNVTGLTVKGKSIFDSVQILTGAGAGKVLTSDANGNASWATLSTGGGTVTPAGPGEGTVCGGWWMESDNAIAAPNYGMSFWGCSSMPSDLTSYLQNGVSSLCPSGYSGRITGYREVVTGSTVQGAQSYGDRANGICVKN